MNRKTRTVLCIVAVSAAFVSLISCRKEVPAGQLITADGIVTDATSGDLFPGVKVYLFGTHFSFNPDGPPPSYSLGPFDSAVTDASGHFSFRYHAEGSSDDYKVTLFNYKQRTDNLFSPYTPGYNSETIFNFAYRLQDLHFLVYRMSGLKLHLTIDDLAQDSMYVYFSPNLSFSDYNYILRGRTIDTVLSAQYVPGNTVSILYRPYSNAMSDTLIGGINYHKELTDTLQLTGSGDVLVEKHIVSTNDFPWHQ